MSLTLLQARRIALAAQGFTRRRPATVDARHLSRTVGRLGFFQIDSVNVLARAHYMPLYSRLGAYDPELLHRASGHAPRRVFEYWAHEAAFVDIELWPAFRFRMDDAAGMWQGPRRIAVEKPELVTRVLEEVRQRGPLSAREIEHDVPRHRGSWGWNWSEVKMALEYLFYTGAVTAAFRNAAFERVYDLPERVMPPEVLARPPLTSDEAHQVLVEHAARAHGVATEQCLRDYFRLDLAPTRAALSSLVASGALEPTTVAGWARPAYRHRDAVLPRRVDARALLSPFDPLVFERTRTERLFEFRYRIEIYVPAHKRVHGYYVLPFLLGDRLVARVDLSADRQASALVVKSAWAETHAPAHTADELAAELAQMARWLGLDTVEPPTTGDLAGELTSALVGRLR